MPALPHRASASKRFATSVFINCPFDDEYWPLFEALVFCLVDCGFEPRCALESQDSGEIRIKKILRLIASSRYSIHDLSRVEVPEGGLPRFNMPFELGLDMGCRRFGDRRARSKRCLVLDSERHRFQASVSDIAGQDIRAHGNLPDKVIDTVRGWIRTATGRTTLPGEVDVRARFEAFSEALPDLCEASGLSRKQLEFADYLKLAQSWLADARERSFRA